MQVNNLKQTVFGCPTIFEWENKKGHSIYFRLRHGYGRIVNENKDKTLIEGIMIGFDGVCSWDDVVDWAKKNKLKLCQK